MPLSSSKPFRNLWLLLWSVTWALPTAQLSTQPLASWSPRACLVSSVLPPGPCPGQLTGTAPSYCLQAENATLPPRYLPCSPFLQKLPRPYRWASSPTAPHQAQRGWLALLGLTVNPSRRFWCSRAPLPEVGRGRDSAPTEADEAQRLPADAGCSRGHLPDLLDTLHPRAFPQRLVQPRVPPVQVKDVTDGGIRRLFHCRRRDVAHSDPWEGRAQGLR